ncbi:hypothetical protein V9T40_014690 [Parthenolecanium corni]|uniref:CDP-diacylglycerol--glycerol-3-phosphate 3-phosphatidyltransferase n=1 Tax=Parthenolecanium corni TaxID=536013 RepID=A0AAN9XXX0_9HEMI
MVRLLLNSIQSIGLWLSSSTPSFPVSGDQVSILHHPDEFHQTLIDLCSQAKRRISLVSLYLGVGEKEQKLVNAIQFRSQIVGSSLKIKVLLDAVRGSRGETKTSRTMVLPLLKENPSSQVALFHSPKLKGILHTLLPTRYNELIGLQHIKLYIIDDTVIMSGANLSHDYFTNRQDRYVIVRNCGQLADFFDGLVDILCDMSLQLDDSNKTTFPKRSYHPYEGNSTLYISELQRRIDSYYKSHVNSSRKLEESDTWIFPTVEIPFCGINYDSELTTKLLESVPENSKILLASGYFNLTEQLAQAILLSKSECNLLMAHPSANGFYLSAGFSQHIPAMYTAISREFFDKVEAAKQSDRVKLYEYIRKGWTFHGKGLWITLPNETWPQLTVVGSSNFGIRSRHRDLESQIIIVTDNAKLRKELYLEQQKLFEFGHPVNRAVFYEVDRQIPKWINQFLWIFKNFL